MNARLRFTLTVLLLAVIVSLIASNYKTTARLNDHSKAQRQRRMEDHSPSDTPVRIVDVRIGQRKVIFKESFDGGDDWLRGLVITLKSIDARRVSRWHRPDVRQTNRTDWTDSRFLDHGLWFESVLA